MKPSPKSPPAATRPQQELSSEIISDLMTAIKGSFYGDLTPKQWAQEYHFLKREVVTWPASWLNKKGVTLPPKRYKEIILGVLNEVKLHGQTDRIKFWPGYLKHCLQKHFQFNAEKYYEEGKGFRAILERATMAFDPARLAPQSGASIDRLSDVHRALKTAHKAKRKQSATPPAQQLPLI